MLEFPGICMQNDTFFRYESIPSWCPVVRNKKTTKLPVDSITGECMSPQASL